MSRTKQQISKTGHRYRALGIHVFAGGFTVGVQRVFGVDYQLEKHGFGLETAEAMCGVKCINGEHWPDFPEGEYPFMYGNPRCTGFSTITSGYGEESHGAWSKQTCDIHEFCDYAVGRADIAIWESVQQAYTTGRPLLDYLRDDVFVPRGYRVAHVFINAGSFGNAQQRKRYFFVAYRDDRNFNITPPTISPYYSVLYDAVWDRRDRKCREMQTRYNSDTEYDEDCYYRLSPDEKATVPHLPNGWGMNAMAKYRFDKLTKRYQDIWTYRKSDIPYSLHSINRLSWLRPAPTLHSSACRFIHPHHDRPLTVGEMAAIMGWPRIPVGEKPCPQIVKGIVPDVGEWLAEQAQAYLDGAWGDDDWQSSYDAAAAEWVGTADAAGAREKVFDMTAYCGKLFDMERYPDAVQKQLQRVRLDVGVGGTSRFGRRPSDY